MWVHLIRKHAECIDGIDLSERHIGDVVEMPEREARTLIAEGWAERTVSVPRHPVVLVVEDDRGLRECYREGLGRRFVVDECADGMSALEYFDHHRPDAVVLDLNLPRLHGETLYHELRHQPFTSGIPVVVVTGIDPVSELPGATVLRKPCDIDALIGALETAMRRG